MMLALLLFQILTATANFSVDLKGSQDNRPSTWGVAEAYEWVKDTLTFKPPSPQHRVEVLSVKGDVVAWPTTFGLSPAIIPDGRYAGVLFGLSRTAKMPDESYKQCSYCNTDTFLYVQGAISRQSPVVRIPLDFDAVDFQLADDHRLVMKAAAWLNDTGLAVHIEPTFVLRYRWVHQ